MHFKFFLKHVQSAKFEAFYEALPITDIYYCPRRRAEATKKTELIQLPETALIFYLAILWSPFLSAANFSECQSNSSLLPDSNVLLKKNLRHQKKTDIQAYKLLTLFSNAILSQQAMV